MSWAEDCLTWALAIARDHYAPPPLHRIHGQVMLAVAASPGKVPEEWRPAWPVFIAWPHAAGAAWHAEEMTAAQLRAELARRDAR